MSATQFKILNNQLKFNPRIVVRGFAGTGKTFLAIEKTRALDRDSKRVLYLCFNENLGVAVAEQLRTCEHATATNFHDFAVTMIGKHESPITDFRVHATPSERDRFWNYEIPERLNRVVQRIDVPYDAVIVDEAQDFSREYFTPIRRMLREDSQFYVFYDPCQAIYRRKDDLATFLGLPTVVLTENCRNTSRINEFIKQFLPDGERDGLTARRLGNELSVTRVQSNIGARTSSINRALELMVDQHKIGTDWTSPHLIDTEKSQYLPTEEDWHGQRKASKVVCTAVQA